MSRRKPHFLPPASDPRDVSWAPVTTSCCHHGRNSWTAGNITAVTTQLIHHIAKTPLIHHIARTPLIHHIAKTQLIHHIAKTPLIHRIGKTPLIHHIAKIVLIHNISKTSLSHHITTKQELNANPPHQ